MVGDNQYDVPSPHLYTLHNLYFCYLTDLKDDDSANCILLKTKQRKEFKSNILKHQSYLDIHQIPIELWIKCRKLIKKAIAAQKLLDKNM